MNIGFASVGWAVLWSAVAALVVWFALLPVRRRSLAGLLASVVLTGTAASIGALLGGIHAMLLPTRDWLSVILLTIAAGAIATVAAATAARRLAQDNRKLRLAVVDLAEGRVPSADGRPLTAELEDVRRQLATTATALAETRDRERALESARRELVAWVSHDLRTPLAGLRAMAEALEDGMVDDPSPYYKQIGASVDRLSGMVDDLFDLSRIQSGSDGSRAAESLPLDDLVSDVLAALGPLAAARRVRLSGTPAGGAVVRGDGPQLDRAITNVVANAIRHTREGGSVEVDVRTVDGLVEVSVGDECGGIAEADLPRLFDVGFRGEAARPPHDDGTAGAGLGLAITRGIVEAHGGSIEVENTAPGCEFRVLLPLA